MSHFEVKVLKMPKFGNAPNSDRLCIVSLFKCIPVIFQKGLYQEGDLIAYIPADSMVPIDRPEFKWLDDGKGNKLVRIRAVKLRGTKSEGVIIPAPAGTKEGDDIKDLLGITKYEEPEPISTGGDEEKDPGYAPHYDIQSYDKYGDSFKAGEEVVITEKIHGMNGMFIYRNDRLWVRSHRQYKKKLDADGNPTTSIWWIIARKLDLEEKMKVIPNLAIYGEVYGQVQDLKYGHQKGQVSFLAFDVYDTATGHYLDHDVAKTTAALAGIGWVPELYRGPFDEKIIESFADGRSTLADNIREGCVIKTIPERYDETLGGRVILKKIGFDYKTRKGGTEHH